jgi:hypothetical protein
MKLTYVTNLAPDDSHQRRGGGEGGGVGRVGGGGGELHSLALDSALPGVSVYGTPLMARFLIVTCLVYELGHSSTISRDLSR